MRTKAPPLLAPLVLLALLVVGCKGFEARNAAVDRFEDGWGNGSDLSDLRVFGRSRLPYFEWVAGGSASYEQSKDNPDAFVVTIPFWCEGRLADGSTVRRRREVTMDMVDRGGWQIERHVVSRDEELTRLRQIASWFGWSAILPLLILLGIATNNSHNVAAVASMLSPAAFRGILALFGLLVSGYIAHLCFGTLVAVFVCPLIQLAVTAALVGMVRGHRSGGG